MRNRLLLACFTLLPLAGQSPEDCSILVRGCGELRVGASALVTRNYDKVSPTAHFEGSLGLTRNLAATGSYSHTWISGRDRLHEGVGGVRFQLPTRTRVTPYGLGVLGVISGWWVRDNSAFVFGTGGGVEVRLHRRAGAFVEARVMWNRSGSVGYLSYYVRPLVVGLYLRSK